MESLVYVCFFGEFKLRQGNREINEQTIHSKKILKLLAYILLNRTRMIGVEELNDFLWGEEGSVNPSGALKNLVYRLRTTMKELGDDEYIYYKAGAYGWNQEIELKIDMEVFKEKAQNVQRMEGTREERMAEYENVISLYSEPKSSRLTTDAWMAVRFTHYHSIFMRVTRELCAMLAEDQQYERMKKVCEYALGCDEYEEDIYYWLIKSWIGLGDIECALEQYEIAVKNLYDRMGIHRSARMGDLYEEIISMKHTQIATMDEIYQNICEEEAGEVFFCEYGIFREIYRLEARRALRTGISEYMVLLTVCLEEKNNEGKELTSYYKKRAMEKLRITLATTLRKADVVARYSDIQYIVMLPTCDSQSAEKVVKRIVQNVNRKLGSRKVKIKSEIKEVLINGGLPENL